MENGVFVVNIAVVAAQHLLLATVAVAAAVAAAAVVAATVVAAAAAAVAELLLTLCCSLSVDMSSCRAMSVVVLVAVAVVRARSYVVYSLTVALSLRQSPHINKQIALNGLCNESCLRPPCLPALPPPPPSSPPALQRLQLRCSELEAG